MPRTNPIAEYSLLSHTEVRGLMNNKPVHLHKTTWIDQSDNSLPGGHLSLRMLILDLVLAASPLRFFPDVAEFFRQLLHCHGRLELAGGASRIKARKTSSGVQSNSLVRHCYFSMFISVDNASIPF